MKDLISRRRTRLNVILSQCVTTILSEQFKRDEPSHVQDQDTIFTVVAQDLMVSTFSSLALMSEIITRHRAKLLAFIADS